MENETEASGEEERKRQRITADSRAAVARGIAWLNETDRGDWYEIVDWDTFDFFDGGRCILGQLVGDVFGWRGGLGMQPREVTSFAQRRGFVDCRWPFPRDEAVITDGGILAEAWREAGAALLMGCEWEA